MAEQPPAGGGNVLTRRYGPAPGYVYLAGAAGLAYLVIRHRSSSATDTTAADSADSTDGSSDLDPAGQDGAGFGQTQPYDMSGQVYTDLAGAQAKLQKRGQQLDHVKANLKQEKATEKKLRSRLGNVAPKTRVITVHKGDDSWKELAAKFGTSVGMLERLNPHVRGKPKIGERIHVPEQKAAHK